MSDKLWGVIGLATNSAALALELFADFKLGGVWPYLLTLGVVGSAWKLLI